MRRGIDRYIGLKDLIICNACEAELWIQKEDEQFYLMRIGPVAVEDCLQCSQLTEAAIDGE